MLQASLFQSMDFSPHRSSSVEYLNMPAASNRRSLTLRQARNNLINRREFFLLELYFFFSSKRDEFFLRSCEECIGSQPQRVDSFAHLCRRSVQPQMQALCGVSGWQASPVRCCICLGGVNQLNRVVRNLSKYPESVVGRHSQNVMEICD